MQDTRQTWVATTERDLPPTMSQIAQAKRKQEEQQSYKELANLAIEDQQLISGGSRAFDRTFTTFKPEEGFKVDDSTFEQLRTEFGAEYAREVVDGVKSTGELEYRTNYYRQDKERAQKLAGYGVEGFVASLASGLLDPVGWGASIVAAPLGGTAKLAGLARIGKLAAMAGAENLALESIMYTGDTQRGVDDLFMAAGAGMVMGGTIAAATRSKVNIPTKESTVVDEGLDTVIRGADEFDITTAKAVRETMEYDAYMAMRDNTPRDVVDHSAAILQHIEDLKKGASIRPTAKEKGNLKGQISEAEAKIEAYRQAKIDETAMLAAERGAPASKGQRLDLDVAKNVLSRKFDAPIKDLEARVQEMRNQLTQYEGVDTAKAELKRFANLPREQQIKELGLDSPRTEVDIKSAVKEALDSIKAERKVTPVEKFEAEQVATKEDLGIKGTDSVGAKRVEDSEIAQEQFDLTEKMEDMMTELAQEAFASNVKPIKVLGNASSVSAVLLNSKNPTNRGLGLRLLENAQGGGAAGKTAAILSDVNNNLIRSAEKNRYNDGFTNYLKEQGLPPTAYLDQRVTAEFNDKIYTAIVNGIPEDAPASLKLAAEGISDKFKKALELRKQAGEAGFEDVKSTKDYVPVVFDGIKITQQTNRLGSKDAVIGALSKGYQTGKFKLSKQAADALAKVQYLRASDSTLSSRVSFDRVVSQEQQAMLVEDMRKAGVPDNLINNFIEGEEVKEIANSVSNRAKQSMGINTQATYAGIRVQDLLNTNIAELAENYGKEAAGGAAMARMGFPTRQAVLNAIDASERAGRNLAGNDAKQIKQLRKEAEMLNDAVKLIYGNTIDVDPSDALVKGTRRLREVTGLLRLGQMGFAQVPEIGRVITKMGVGTVLKAIPATKIFRSRAARKGGTARGELLEPELREMEQVVGYIGEDNWLSGWNVRHDEFGENFDNAGRIAKVVDNALAAGSRINTVLSGFKAIQGGSEKIAYRSINMRLKQHLEGTKKLPQRDLDEIGLTEEVMARLKKHYDEKPKYDTYNGEKIRMMNFDEMDSDLRELVGVGVRRMAGRLIQRNFIGDEGVWVNKWWGKALTQFKSFSIVSLEKQLVHDLRGDKAAAAQILAWTSLLGYASYSSQMHLQALGREDRDEFLDTKFESNNVAFGVFNKLPQVAAFGLGGDFLATIGAMPDSMMQGTGRMGFQSMGAGELVPAIGVVGDGLDLVRAMGQYATGSDDVSTRQLVDKVRRLVPLANTIGVGQMTKASVDLLED